MIGRRNTIFEKNMKRIVIKEKPRKVKFLNKAYKTLK